MMSVVMDRPISARILTAWGECSFSYSSGTLPGCFLTCTVGQFLSAFYLGWLAAPLTHLLFGLWPCFRETPILAGGIGVARVVVGAVLVSDFGFEQF